MIYCSEKQWEICDVINYNSSVNWKEANFMRDFNQWSKSIKKEWVRAI